MRPITFLGDSLERIRSFPEQSRRLMGYQLDRVQRGLMPEDWKPMGSVGAGVYEVRIRDVNGAFRTLYVAKFPEAVYVLHAFQKKTRTTAKADLAQARERFKELLRSRK